MNSAEITFENFSWINSALTQEAKINLSHHSRIWTGEVSVCSSEVLFLFVPWASSVGILEYFCMVLGYYNNQYRIYQLKINGYYYYYNFYYYKIIQNLFIFLTNLSWAFAVKSGSTSFKRSRGMCDVKSLWADERADPSVSL